MSENTYEYECMRAELLGIEKPDKDAFEKARLEMLKQEQEEQEAAEAATLNAQEEGLKNTGSKLDELNSILSSTQQKLNRFKQTACGSFSGIFHKGTSSIDVEDANVSSTSQSRRNTNDSKGSTEDIVSQDATQDSETTPGLESAEQHKEDLNDVQPVIPTEKIRQAKLDIGRKMSSHLDKLDSLINKANQAEISMSEQTKQMKKMAK